MNNGNHSLDDCDHIEAVFEKQALIIASNRGPFSAQRAEDGRLEFHRSSGGLATALLGLANRYKSTWISSPAGEEDRAWGGGRVPITDSGETVTVRFIEPTEEAFTGFYQVIANPLLWFLQHSIWDYSTAPIINRATWEAWDRGYVEVNRLFAEAIIDQIRRNNRQTLVMIQDYHLYLVPRMIRKLQRSRRSALISHFVHIPWPGPEDWGLLPGRMREAILDGLCVVDLLGFQTQGDALNFIRTCESLLPGARVNYRRGTVMLGNHVTRVKDFPISIDVQGVREQAQFPDVAQFHQQLEELAGDRKIILRIDRTEPSKNIVRGFQAYDEMLETYPEHRGKVQFLALMVPSRLEVEQYQDYLSSLMAAAGIVNAKYGTSDWEPVRVLVGESYSRALAALQLYDVLLVNPVADGMNLVAKEGPAVNEKYGVVVLSERAGVHQQMGGHALVIAPVDISATADALHQGLTMPEAERAARAVALRQSVEREDINLWMCWQLEEIQKLIEANRKMRAHAGA